MFGAFRKERDMPVTSTTTAEEFTAPRLFTRAEALATLKIGETTLFWLQRTGKLVPIRIGSRVLFNASAIMRIATHGASLTEAEKQAATRREREIAQSRSLIGTGEEPGSGRVSRG
jgi:hypothetical protein